MSFWIILILALGGIGVAVAAYLQTPEKYRSTISPDIPPLAGKCCKHCGSKRTLQGRLTPGSGEAPTLSFTSEQTRKLHTWKDLLKLTPREESQLRHVFTCLEKNHYNFCVDCGLIYGFTDISLLEDYRQKFGNDHLQEIFSISSPERSDGDHTHNHQGQS